MKALAIVAVLTSTASAAPTANDVLASVQKFYTATKHLTVTFHQEVTHKAFGKVETSKGHAWILKPADFRFDYDQDIKGKTQTVKTFTFDGTTGSYVDRINKKITKTAATSGVMPAAVSFLTGGNGLAKQFDATIDASKTYDDKDTVIALTPKQPSAEYAKLVFVVAANGHVRKSIVIASNGDSNAFEFFAPDDKTDVPASLFVVDPKSVDGYAVETVK